MFFPSLCICQGLRPAPRWAAALTGAVASPINTLYLVHSLYYLCCRSCTTYNPRFLSIRAFLKTFRPNAFRARCVGQLAIISTQVAILRGRPEGHFGLTYILDVSSITPTAVGLHRVISAVSGKVKVIAEMFRQLVSCAAYVCDCSPEIVFIFG